MIIIAPCWSDNPFNNELRWLWSRRAAFAKASAGPIPQPRRSLGVDRSPGRQLWLSHRKNIQRRILQQHDGLRIHDAAVGDHGERLVYRQFQHLDILAFVGNAAAAADPHRWVIFADKEVQFFGDRSGAHEGFENFSNVPESIASLLFRLGANSSFRRLVV